MDTECKSRTRKKKEDHALQRLGEQLTALPPVRLKTLALPDEIVAAIEFTRKIKSHGARRRQMKHIGALLRQLDPLLIEAVFACMRSENPHKQPGS